MREISILGCGWLGLPLAERLVLKGCNVKGSTTSAAKISVLEDSGVMPYQIHLWDDRVEGNLSEFLNSKILIIDIPPGKTGKFSEKIKTLLPYIESSAVRKVIFISSISVYGDALGEVDENSLPVPSSENGLEILKAEHLLSQNTNFKTTILRFGGLYGEERHPINSMSGKINDNPNARVNLTHLCDCIGIIITILMLDKWDVLYNVVSPSHPTRRDYYTKIARERELPPPLFNEGGNEGKIVRVDNVCSDLGYLFYKPFL